MGTQTTESSPLEHQLRVINDEHSISAIGMTGMTILAPDMSEMMDL